MKTNTKQANKPTKYTNQPTDQPTNYPANQSTTQPTNRLPNLPSRPNQASNEPSKSTNQPSSPTTYTKSVCCLVALSLDHRRARRWLFSSSRASIILSMIRNVTRTTTTTTIGCFFQMHIFDEAFHFILSCWNICRIDKNIPCVIRNACFIRNACVVYIFDNHWLRPCQNRQWVTTAHDDGPELLPTNIATQMRPK